MNNFSIVNRREYNCTQRRVLSWRWRDASGHCSRMCVYVLPSICRKTLFMDYSAASAAGRCSCCYYFYKLHVKFMVGQQCVQANQTCSVNRFDDVIRAFVRLHAAMANAHAIYVRRAHLLYIYEDVRGQDVRTNLHRAPSPIRIVSFFFSLPYGRSLAHTHAHTTSIPFSRNLSNFFPSSSSFSSSPSFGIVGIVVDSFLGQ